MAVDNHRSPGAPFKSRSVETPLTAVPTSVKPVGFLCPNTRVQADAMPASGGRLIQHPQGKYARRLLAVSNLPTSRLPYFGGRVISRNEDATMSKLDSGDLNMPGYFLPEDSQSRLKKLRDHIAFLSRLAQP